MTKICVLGAGAVGSLVGGLIQYHAPETEVTMLARGEHGRRMAERGTLVMQGPWGTREVKVRTCESIDQIDGCDLVVLTVKSQDTAATIEAALPRIGSAMVVSLQNGINQRVLSRYLPAEQFLVGMTATNMAIVEPGTVSLQRNGVTVVGSTAEQPPQDALQEVLRLLRKSGLRMELQSNVRGVQLNKVAINTIGYTSVLSRSNFLTECILDRRWRNEVAKPILDECLAVYAAAGIQLETVPGPSDIRRFRRMLDILDRPVIGRLWATAIRKMARQRIVYSVEQDLVRRRPTEIEYVNGEIVRLAEEHGRTAPLNARVVQLVHELENQPELRFLEFDEVIDQLRAVRLEDESSPTALRGVAPDRSAPSDG